MSIRTRDQLSSQESSPDTKHLKMAGVEHPTIEMVYKLLQEIQNNISMMREDNKQTNLEVQDLKKSLTFQMGKVEDLNKENSELRKQIEEQGLEILSLKFLVRQLNGKIEEVETSQDALNQYNRKHNLVITGIPERPEEDLEEAIKELGDLVNAPIEDDEIDIVHRLNSKVSPRPVIVKFVQYSAKKNLYLARKKLKQIKTEQFEDTNCLHGANKIFINENLTPQRGLLFSEVRKRVKQNKWHSSYTMDGKIFVKKFNGGRAFKIEKQADLEDLYG